MSNPKTIAQEIAEQFNMDGQCWTNEDGIELVDLLKARTSYGDRDDDESGETCRYTFSDGSTIIANSAWWDLGFKDCFCPLGMGHAHDCETLPEITRCESGVVIDVDDDVVVTNWLSDIDARYRAERVEDYEVPDWVRGAAIEAAQDAHPEEGEAIVKAVWQIHSHSQIAWVVVFEGWI